MAGWRVGMVLGNARGDWCNIESENNMDSGMFSNSKEQLLRWTVTNLGLIRNFTKTPFDGTVSWEIRL
jgi:hypothetical protein